MHVKLQSGIALFTCSCLVSVASAPSSVGFMVTGGQAQVDGSMVRGNSTLFQGSLVRAGDVTSDLVFPGGTNLLLQPGSTARVYRDYAVLENGTATQHGSHGYVIADGLRISSPSPLGAIIVGMTDRSHLEITAQSGTAEVRNQAGGLVARLETGKAASFVVQDQNAAPTGSPAPASSQGSSAATAAVGTQLTIHGILRKDHAGKYGHYLLTDLASNVTYELQGSELEDLVGGSVEVTGSIFDAAPAAGAVKVVSVSDIHQMPLGEISGSATAANATPAAPPTPSGDELPTNGAGPEVGATPEAKAPPEPTPAPEVSSEPAAAPEPPPLPIHTDTAKVLIIVGLAAGIGVGVALGLAGGKSSTVSPE
jgi:hypothetical protein